MQSLLGLHRSLGRNKQSIGLHWGSRPALRSGVGRTWSGCGRRMRLMFWLPKCTTANELDCLWGLCARWSIQLLHWQCIALSWRPFCLFGSMKRRIWREDLTWFEETVDIRILGKMEFLKMETTEECVDWVSSSFKNSEVLKLMKLSVLDIL